MSYFEFGMLSYVNNGFKDLMLINIGSLVFLPKILESNGFGLQFFGKLV